MQTGIHARRTAMTSVGVTDPEAEFRRWLDERAAILRMNREFNARTVRRSERDSTAADTAENTDN